jgi:UDP-2,4-diacetamido-2,4,6-trideoxy-beta-L-altropyranose hydrolase
MDIGTGHVMRCLTLAEMMRKRDAEILFVCREHAGHLCDLITARGFAIARLAVNPATNRATQTLAHAGWLGASWQEDAEQTLATIARAGAFPDVLIVDHYALDQNWERRLRPAVGRIFVMDDLADRPHDCDLLLDQGLHDLPESRYAGLVNSSTRVFAGPRYALLRPEFNVVVPVRGSRLERMLIFLGGIDPTNEAQKLVSALHILGPEAPATTLVLGRNNPNTADIRRVADGLTAIRVIDSTTEMARLMIEADLGVGTCGGAAWERCAVGLPSLVVVNADNQRDDARILHSLGAVRNLGEAAPMTGERWAAEIRAIKNDSAVLTRMSQAAAAVMRGREQAIRDLEAALVG